MKHLFENVLVRFLLKECAATWKWERMWTKNNLLPANLLVGIRNYRHRLRWRQNVLLRNEGRKKEQEKKEEKQVSETRKKANVGPKVNYCIRFSANVALWMPKFLQPHTPQPPKLECSEWSFIWQKQSNSLIYRLRSTMNGRFYVHLYYQKAKRLQLAPQPFWFHL